MGNANAVIAALRSGHDGLAAVVTALTGDDLALPSGASGWDVSEVLSHLGSGTEITQAGLVAALDGAAPPGREANQAVWGRWNAMSRSDRAAGFLQASGELTARYESVEQDTRESLRVDLGSCRHRSTSRPRLGCGSVS